MKLRTAVLCCTVVAASAAHAECVPAARPFFSQAWDALANVHLDEARALFTQTIAVDPRCTLAWAYLGSLTPGAAGARMLDDARDAAAPKEEQLVVQALAALHAGTPEAAVTALRQAHDAAPKSYEAAFLLAQRLAVLERWGEAVEVAQRATKLAPARGPAWNVLGYALLGQRKPEAVAAFQSYARAAPSEPNAHDSLGDALLANGQWDAARAAYQKALETSGDTFWPSEHGVATACAMQGDWFCARAAIEKARRLATQPNDRVGLLAWSAWSLLAAGQGDEALATLDELEQDARRSFLDDRVAEARVLKGRFLTVLGRPKDALAVLQTPGKPLVGAAEPQRQALEATRLHALALAQVKTGAVAEAEKTLARLREVKGDVAVVKDLAAHAGGVVALAKGQTAAAVGTMRACSEALLACRLELALAQAKTDPAAAQKTLADLLGRPRREPEYWWVRVQALQASKAEKPAAL